MYCGDRGVVEFIFSFSAHNFLPFNFPDFTSSLPLPWALELPRTKPLCSQRPELSLGALDLPV